jgi:hypothetical protein
LEGRLATHIVFVALSIDNRGRMTDDTNLQTPTPPLEPAKDVSPRVHELMQRIDRLPPGTYELILVKPEIRAVEWDGRITDKNKDMVIDTFSISKRKSNYAPE